MSEYKKTLLYNKITGLNANISQSSLEKLLNAAIRKHVLKGDIILHQGRICRHLFFVESGYLRTFIEKNGNEIILILYLKIILPLTLKVYAYQFLLIQAFRPEKMLLFMNLIKIHCYSFIKNHQR
jgi:hypothetical protein